MDVHKIIKENKRRLEEMFAPYDPILGIGSPIPRQKVSFYVGSEHIVLLLPTEMVEKEFALQELITLGSVKMVIEKMGKQSTPHTEKLFYEGLMGTRAKYDFEFWAYTRVKIQDKKTKGIIPFRLNRAQRLLLEDCEGDRRNGKPIRVILLKARQFGGSTFFEIYMGWIQNELTVNWHSAIIADVESQVGNIRSMYNRMAKEYPKNFGTITLVPFEGSSKNKLVKERNCIIGVGSAQKPDSLRSFDFAMVHITELGIWKSTPQRSSEDLLQSIRAMIPDVPLSLEAVESTAKGVGNVFHREWLAAKSKKSGYRAVFIPWWKIEMYMKKMDVPDVGHNPYEAFIKKTFKDKYVQYLWEIGATIEGIKWYLNHRKEKNYDHWRMCEEFPSDDVEAFQSTGQRVYPQRYVQLSRKTCMEPEWTGDIRGKTSKGKTALTGVKLEESKTGLLSIWSMPDDSVKVSNRYVVSVDIGGRTETADWSVIKVFDRYWMMHGGAPEVAATWKGHIDQDLLAWKAAQIAKVYNNALLVVESNSLTTGDEEAGHHLTILDEIVEFYKNIYTRTSPEKVKQGLPVQYGFHTNSSTKTLVIDTHIGAIRDGEYVERDHRACDEMDTYEKKQNGKLGAKDGAHDDILMATAIGVWICISHLPPPKEVKEGRTKAKKKITGEATF